MTIGLLKRFSDRADVLHEPGAFSGSDQDYEHEHHHEHEHEHEHKA